MHTPRNLSYIASCFKLWALKRACSRFSYLFQTLSERRWRTVRIHVEVVPVVSWNIQERGTVLGAVAPRTSRTIHTWWKLTVYCNYLFIPGETFAHATRKGVLYDRSRTRAQKASRALYYIYDVLHCVCTQCVSLFHVEYRFTTYMMSEWMRQQFMERTWRSLFSLLIFWELWLPFTSR